MELVHESMTKIADGHGHDFHLPHSNDHHAVFNQSVTDLVAYMGNETQDVKGQGKKWTKITSFKKEHVMDICDEVGKIFFADKQANHRNRLKWGTLKKRDMVDLILINELRCDEHNWTDYDNDEHTVKEQLCHVMFELLIHDTLTSFKQINNLKTGVHSE
uniref:DUF4378 domain-containing protein n=1 Tax=Ciona savignyi TaxID=51511 RepID=H2ZDU0_CIOSA